MAGCGCSLCP